MKLFNNIPDNMPDFSHLSSTLHSNTTALASLTFVGSGIILTGTLYPLEICSLLDTNLNSLTLGTSYSTDTLKNNCVERGIALELSD